MLMGSTLTESIHGNISELISRYEKLLAENAEMAARLESCERALNENSLTIKELKEKNDKLQLTAALGGADSDSRGQAKRKVAQLIRDIDKCIALLNE